MITCHYPDLSSASDWSCSQGNLLQPMRNTSQIWVVTRHKYGHFCVRLSDLISQENQWWHRAHSVGCFLRLGRYVTIQFQDRRGAPVTETAPNHHRLNSINPYPIWFSCWRSSYPVKCTHRLTRQCPHFLLVHKETQTKRNKETEQDKNFSLTGKTGRRLE